MQSTLVALSWMVHLVEGLDQSTGFELSRFDFLKLSIPQEGKLSIMNLLSNQSQSSNFVI